MNRASLEEQMLAYPIFHLTGGTASQQKQFVKRLLVVLDRCLLYSGVVVKAFPNRFELSEMVRQYDLVIVDGPVNFPMHKIHIGCGGHNKDEDLVWPGGDDTALDVFLEQLLSKLGEINARVPVWACILIGGKSSRMGQPKHLLESVDGNGSWLEAAVELVTPLTDGVVVSGKGDIPQSLDGVQRIPDIPGVAGPLTGILSAMRWQPDVSWLLLACDMPLVTKKALEWLLDGYRPGCWGRIPRLPDADYCEPLLAWYSIRTAHLFEEQLLCGNLRIGSIAKHLKVDNPIIPDSLRTAWQNINTPEQLQLMKSDP